VDWDLVLEGLAKNWGLVLFLGLVVLYAAYSQWLGRFSITMPMIFVFIGALVGPHALDWVSYSLTASSVKTLTEVTLALLLFADAVTVNFIHVRADAPLSGRLLLIGQPLIILLGGLAAFAFFPGQGLGFALLLGTVLAPTDEALGTRFLNNPRVPVRVRRSLHVESGLNDGIASPLVVLFIAMMLQDYSGVGDFWVLVALAQIAIGTGVGLVLGWGSGWLFRHAVEKKWASKAARQLANPALALLVYFGASALGGNGFVAVFMAGIVFGLATRHLLQDATEYTEITGTLLSLFVWARFGATLVIPLLQSFNLQGFLYALLSLTAVRMIPVAIALVGTRLRPDTKLMMGWLGPRGLASVVFMLMAYEAAKAAGIETENLVTAATWTILLSVLLHGFSALPLANWYARRLETAGPDAPELVDLPELPTRHRTWHDFLHLPHLEGQTANEK
jgi:NhaP-type Na+/H+ or K+/H+ antiporter